MCLSLLAGPDDSGHPFNIIALNGEYGELRFETGKLKHRAGFTMQPPGQDFAVSGPDPGELPACFAFA